MHYFKSFDLNWESSELIFPEFAKRNKFSKVDVKINKENPINWPDIKTNKYDTNCLRFSSNDVRININNIGNLRILDGNSISWFKSEIKLDDEDIKAFILGSALGTILIQRGLLVFHANSLEKDGKGIICLGSSGAGKSTLAYLLMNKGWKLIADDLVAVTPDGNILPGIPRIKLWQDVLEALNMDFSKLPRVRSKINKFIITAENIFKTEEKVPLNHIFVLDRPIKYSQNQNINISAIKSQQIAFLFLKSNFYRPRIIRALGMEPLYFQRVVELLKMKPVSKLYVPNNLFEIVNLMNKFDDKKLINF